MIMVIQPGQIVATSGALGPKDQSIAKQSGIKQSNKVKKGAPGNSNNTISSRIDFMIFTEKTTPPQSN